MTERIAITAGIRSPFCKAGGLLREMEADDLGAFVVKELAERSGISPDEIDHLVFGNVMQPPHAGNIARVVAIKAGLPQKVPASTVNRNCASGLEAISTAANMIRLGEAQVVVAGGCESMSNFPILFGRPMRDFLQTLSKAKTFQQKLLAFLSFRPSFLKPHIPELSDPLCGLNMGQTAELLARDFHVTREEQDAFALRSQQRASQAIQEGRLAEEIVPLPLPPQYSKMQLIDDGPRANQTLDSLSSLKPAFDKVAGTVTAGTSSQVTDGAVALLMMTESKAKSLGLKPLGYIKDFAYAGLEPARMGLGPVFSTAKLLEKTNLKLQDFDLIEINEAFAAQVLACVRAFNSEDFCREKLGLSQPLGAIDMDKLNVNGGAIALGHPLGASGARLVLTLLKELNRRKQNLGLATLCVGGGQGGALAVEVQ